MTEDLKLNMDAFLPLRDVVFNTLREAILKGDLKPGERLMELQLAAQLGVSRTPIREAIRMLEQEGLAVTVPRKGAEVAKMTLKGMEDVLEIREALDILACQLACERITEEQLAALKGEIIIDTEMSRDSENAVQNKVIVAYIDKASNNAYEIFTSEFYRFGKDVERFIAENVVLKTAGKDLSTNDFTDEDKIKLDNSASKEYVDGSLNLKADASTVYTKDVIDASVNAAIEIAIAPLATTEALTNGLAEKADASTVYTKTQIDASLATLATSEALTNGLATKLDASAKVNGVSFVEGEATIDAGDIALESDITRTGEGGEIETVYASSTSLQSILESLNNRIDVLDPNVSGELGITSITAGNGIVANVSGGQATISVKASDVEGNMAEVKTDGVYVADMRSYWEAI